MRKKNFNSKLSSLFTALCCTIMGLFFQTASGQNPCPGPGYQCSSGDITIIRVSLVQAGNHNPLPNICPGGSNNVAVALKVEFNVTSQTRYGFIVTADVYSGPFGGTLTKIGKIANCFEGTFAQGPQTRYVENYVGVAPPVNWSCGSRIQLQNVYTAWDNAAVSPTNPSICTQLLANGSIDNCKKVAPKCRVYGPSESFEIITPLIAGFSVSYGACNTDLTRTVTFTNTSTGGTTPYTSSWTFSDGTTSTAASPTHDFAAGTYTANLTVTDAAAGTAQQTSSTSHSNNVVVETCCVPSTVPTGITKGIDNFCSGSGPTLLTPTGGSKGTNGSYKWYTGSCGGTLVHTGDTYSVNPATTTTYYVGVDGTCTTTTACASVTVNVKPNLAVPAASVTTAPTCGVATGTVTVSPFDNTITYTLTQNGSPVYTANGSGVFPTVAVGTYLLKAAKTGSCGADGNSVTVVEAAGAPPAADVDIITSPDCSSSTGTLKVVKASDGTDYSSDFAISVTGSNDWHAPDYVFTFKAGEGYNFTVKRISDNTCTVTTSCEGETAKNNTTNLTSETPTARVLGSATLESSVTVKAMPNPFSDQVRFTITNPESGSGTLEIYNMTGQKIKTVYQGNIPEGVSYFDLKLATRQTANLIYVLRIGDRKMTGKMLQINR